jgi:hypothetical protein
VEGKSVMNVWRRHPLFAFLSSESLPQKVTIAMSTTNGTTHGAVSSISALPEYVSQEKHKEILASTPADFSTLPPVLVYLAQDVSVSFTPPMEGFSTDEPTKGSLYVIDRSVVFLTSATSFLY